MKHERELDVNSQCHPDKKTSQWYLSNVDDLLDAQVPQLAHHELRVKGAGHFQLVRLQAANKVRRGGLERGDEAAQLLEQLGVCGVCGRRAV